MTDTQFFPYRLDNRWSPLFRVLRVIGLKAHSSLWVSVEDPEGLAKALDRAAVTPAIMDEPTEK